MIIDSGKYTQHSQFLTSMTKLFAIPWHKQKSSTTNIVHQQLN